MSRYLGPVCKLCRRAGEKLYLKGERCFSEKCALEDRSYPPGQHGKEQAFRRRKLSDYGMQLQEKQKARRIYGIQEQQFRRYFREAERRSGLTGVNLLVLLETRLDNVVYRLGMATSRAHARQLVSHGHFMVNGHKTNIPAYGLKVGDVVSVRPESRQTTYFKALRENLGQRAVPSWLSLDAEKLEGRVLAMPARQEIDVPVREQLIVEFYSR